MNKKFAALLAVLVLTMAGCSTNQGNTGENTTENNATENNAQDNNATNSNVHENNAQGNNTTENAVDDMNNNTENANNTGNQSANIGDGTGNEINYDGDNNVYHVEDLDIVSGDEALKRLKAGNERFINNKSALINVTDERREDLEEGQNPYAVIVSCSDSRVTPSTVFNAGLGEIFDIRLAGNILSEEALGSIEYGVEHLHAPLLVIIGHEKCGAVTAAYDKMTEGVDVVGNINSLVDAIEPAIQNAENIDHAVHMNIDYVYDEVMQDEIVKHLVENGSLKVVRAYYSLDGNVAFYE